MTNLRFASGLCSHARGPRQKGNLIFQQTQTDQGTRRFTSIVLQTLEGGEWITKAAFPIMIIGMLTLLMMQLQSFKRLAIVFFTAPLGIIGASIALNLAHKPFGFVALLGLIALAGMDMRNTVILVDQIETDVRERGLTRREAIVFSTMRRARPVALTALAAILAMIPLSESAFWGPMAYTIMGGLSLATFLTLFLLPSIYALWFRKSLGPAPEPARSAQTPHPDFAAAAPAE